MEGGARQPDGTDGTDWPVIGEDARTLYQLLFYSQGPVDGYLLGEHVRDLFLKSGLSLRVLSQIWNLADVSNDNVLNVHEFVLVMHLIRGLLKGLKAPLTLPRKLTPPKTPPVSLPPPTAQEREAYTKIFTALDVKGKGFLDGDACRHVLEASGLTSEVLSHVWNLSDVTRDGQLDVGELCVACHLLRFIKAGNTLSGPVDVFTLLPDKVASQSLQARKRRVQQYEQHKQKLMSLKEKRRLQVVQENRRLQLQQEKLDLLRQVYKEQKKAGRAQVSEEQFSTNVDKEKEEIEKLEEIVYRLKKEHEKVRQETVKIILAEQKLNNDIVTIKKDTDELNKRLVTCHTHATKDPDPFHQLYEQRKEKRQGSTIKDLDKIDVALPFTFNPFDPGLCPSSLALGEQLFAATATGNNHGGKRNNSHALIESLAGFGEGFDAFVAACAPSLSADSEEEDLVFKEVSVPMEHEGWLGLQWGTETDPGVLGLSGHDTEQLQEKLFNLKAELRKLNEPGTRLLFKNPDDYLARKRAREEEEKADRSRFQRRSVTDRRSGVLDSPRARAGGGGGGSGAVAGVGGSGGGDSNSPRLRDRVPRERLSYTERNEEVSQAVREYRLKRQSLQSQDSSQPTSATSSASSSPKDPRLPSTHERPSADKTSSTPTPRETLDKPSAREPSSDSVPQPVVNNGFTSPSPVAETVQVASTVTVVSTAPEPSRDSVTENVDKERNIGLEPTPKRQQPQQQQQQQSAKSGEERAKQQQQNGEIVPKTEETEGRHKAKVPESAAVTASRASSKKGRAPPPPPAGSARPPEPPAAGTTADQHKAGISPQQIDPSRAGSLQSQPPPQQPPSSSSPERPTRNKKRKESGKSASGSKPSSPQNDLPQPPLQPSVGDASATLLLAENACLEEEAPPAQGTVVSKVSRKEKTAEGAKDPVPPVAVDGVSQSSDPVRPKRKKGKAPVPPSSSSGSSPRDPPSSSTPSPGNSPRDAPLSVPAEKTPAPRPAEIIKPERSRSVKTKAPPPPPQQSRANPAPGPAKDTATPAELSARDVEVTVKAEPPRPEAARQSVEVAEANSREEVNVKVEPSRTVTRETVVTKQVEVSVKTEPSSARPADPAAKVPPPGIVPNKAEAPVSSAPPVPRLNLPDDLSEPVNLTRGSSKERDLDHERGRLSETSSICDSDADSIPPPLPSSAPPPLPTSLPPTELSQDSGFLVEEEVIEVVQVSASQAPPPPGGQVSEKMEDGVLMEFDAMLPDTLPDAVEDPQGQQKSLANLRAQFFGLSSTSSSSQPVDDHLDYLMGGRERKAPGEDGHSSDSDLSSDERGAEGTFSPGDSGVVMSSLPTSPDDGDGRIQLLSYTTTADHTTTTTTITTTHSQRPQSLPVTDAPPSKDTLSPTSGGVVSSHDMATLSPRSREIFQKARHFAEMVQTPSYALSKKENGEGVQDLSLQDLEMERRAIISQATVRRREVREGGGQQAPPPSVPPLALNIGGGEEEEVVEDAEVVQERFAVSFADVAEVERPAQQTSKTEDVQSSDRTQGPEARWSDKTGKVNLYSENVVKEADSTDEVDRESIANLATTRRQWESIFSTEPKEDSTSKPKKNPPKWQVRMPYAEKTAAGPATVTATTVSADSESPPSTPSSSMADTESAIEREIRLALEREEMLKREQEERVRQASLQPQRTYQVSSMESSTESELQPTFHELAEADRGSEFFINDQAVQREDAEREESLQKGFSQQKLHNASRADDNATESIIEREIRLQREREAELAQQRGGFSSPSTVVAAEPAVQRQRSPSPPLVEEEADLVVEEIPYEEAISQFNHEGESRIARELRELREREEEVRQLRERMTKVGAGEASQQKDTAAPPASKQPAKPVSAPQTPRGGDRSVPSTPRGGDKSTPTTPRVTMNFSRSVHASPRLDTSTPPESTSAAAPKPETPIEREIRLARERENELRRAKGLPELQPVPKKQESFDEPASEEFVGTPRYTPAQPDTTMRRFASNRLQQEIQDQRNREMTLRQEGKIISTSEEHIQPHKYTEVVGQDKVDGGTVKRNFRMPTRHSSNASQEDSGSAESTPRPQATVSTPRDGKPGKKGAGAGSLSFSYREFAQTAESKIERELREMREREEELRKQRSGGGES